MNRSTRLAPIHNSLIVATAGAALALASGAQAQVLSDGVQSASGDFDVVYNLPADAPGPALPNNIGDVTGATLTQMNINAGATYFYGQRDYFFTELNLHETVPNPGSGTDYFDSEVNVFAGGTLGFSSNIGANSTLNMTGGTVQNALLINGVANISGGTTGTGNTINGTLNLSGTGIFLNSNTANSGSVVNITGGQFGTFTSSSTFNSGSTVNVSGGTVQGGNNYSGVVNLSGGTLVNSQDVNNGGVFNMTGGNITLDLDINDGGIGNISGGDMGNRVDIKSGGVMNMTGGTYNSDFDVEGGGILNMSGGTLGNFFDVNAGGTFNLSGTSFTLDGNALSAGLHVIAVRDVLLTGVLEDSSAFNFFLSSVDTGPTYADSTATVTVNVVPEPGSLALLGLGGLAMLRRRR